MTKIEIEPNLKVNGWKLDRWWHWQIKIKHVNFRIKMGKISCRFESKSGGLWLNHSLKTGYYKEVVIKQNSKDQRAMVIGNRLIRMEIVPCM